MVVGLSDPRVTLPDSSEQGYLIRQLEVTTLNG